MEDNFLSLLSRCYKIQTYCLSYVIRYISLLFAINRSDHVLNPKDITFESISKYKGLKETIAAEEGFFIIVSKERYRNERIKKRKKKTSSAIYR